MEARIVTRTTALAPMANERKIEVGTTNMPISAITTVMPENTTARAAVSPATPMAVVLSCPCRRSSRKRAMTSSA